MNPTRVLLRGVCLRRRGVCFILVLPPPVFQTLSILTTFSPLCDFVCVSLVLFTIVTCAIGKIGEAPCFVRTCFVLDHGRVRTAINFQPQS